MDTETGNSLEMAIDRILFSARDLKKKLETIKDGGSEEFTESRLNHLKGTQKIKELERENTELRQALEDHQYGLEFIMSKYRSQVVELIKLNKMERSNTPTETSNMKQDDDIN